MDYFWIIDFPNKWFQIQSEKKNKVSKRRDWSFNSYISNVLYSSHVFSDGNHTKQLPGNAQYVHKI